ncbi:MAG: hypothetical protein L0H83_03570 [Salinisphaera sp.]|nr:hypothetical protein [Salinisphaera sp.]
MICRGLPAAACALLVVVTGAAQADGPQQPLQLHLDAGIQARAGLETAALTAAVRRPRLRAVALVLPLTPLLTDRAAVIDARAAAQAASARLQASQDAFARLQKLYEANANIAARKLAQAQAQRSVDAADLAAAQARFAQQRAGFRHAWGANLAEQAFTNEDREFAALLEGRAVLARLALPAGATLPKTTHRVWLSRTDERGAARSARVIAPAPATVGPGETWLLRTEAKGLRAGMRLYAWVPMDNELRQGVLLPASAVVGQAGRPWAYVQTDANDFVRRPVEATQTGRDFWFVPSGFAAGERVVATGAQLLLGQELRARIPQEDDE